MFHWSRDGLAVVSVRRRRCVHVHTASCVADKQLYDKFPVVKRSIGDVADLLRGQNGGEDGHLVQVAFGGVDIVSPGCDCEAAKHRTHTPRDGVSDHGAHMCGSRACVAGSGWCRV